MEAHLNAVDSANDFLPDRPTHRRLVFAKCVREQGKKEPSHRPRANVRPASTAKEEPIKLVFQSFKGNLLRRRGRPMKYSGELLVIANHHEITNARKFPFSFFHDFRSRHGGFIWLCLAHWHVSIERLSGHARRRLRWNLYQRPAV
jgi:hypothetical protein